MINFIRVDHRLLHGQIIYSWLKSVNCDTIFVVNDSVACDEHKKNTLRMVKPIDKKLVMKSVDDAIQLINSGVTDKYQIFLVVESIKDLMHLVTHIEGVKSINLGGTLASDHSEMVFPQINLTDNDKDDLKLIMAKGIEIEYRLVPSDNKVILNKKWEV